MLARMSFMSTPATHLNPTLHFSPIIFPQAQNKYGSEHQYLSRPLIQIYKQNYTIHWLATSILS